MPIPDLHTSVHCLNDHATWTTRILRIHPTEWILDAPHDRAYQIVPPSLGPMVVRWFAGGRAWQQFMTITEILSPMPLMLVTPLHRASLYAGRREPRYRQNLLGHFYYANSHQDGALTFIPVLTLDAAEAGSARV